VSKLKITVTELKSKRCIDISDNLYFFEEQGIERLDDFEVEDIYWRGEVYKLHVYVDDVLVFESGKGD